MCIKCLLDRLERDVIRAGRVVTTGELRQAIDRATNGRLGPFTLDRYTARLGAKIERSAPFLIRR